MNLREILWTIGLTKEYVCPRCKGDLIRHGFSGHNERYTCKSCDFGRRDSND